MANSAAINATPEQKVLRNIGRIKRLKQAIADEKSTAKPERLAELQAELERRMADVNELKAQLEDL